MRVSVRVCQGVNEGECEGGVKVQMRVRVSVRSRCK